MWYVACLLSFTSQNWLAVERERVAGRLIFPCSCDILWLYYSSVSPLSWGHILLQIKVVDSWLPWHQTLDPLLLPSSPFGWPSMTGKITFVLRSFCNTPMGLGFEDCFVSCRQMRAWETAAAAFQSWALGICCFSEGSAGSQLHFTHLSLYLLLIHYFPRQSSHTDCLLLNS